MRNIEDILMFRQDISPFLVHLTRNIPNGLTAHQALESIIHHRYLHSKGTEISDARFGIAPSEIPETDRLKYFGAVSLTETPISEIHCLLEIACRKIQLQPYGLVFLKERLQMRGVSPVVYLNNENQDKEPVVQALCHLMHTNPKAATEFLPLIAVFGWMLRSPGITAAPPKKVDFRWEREWRYPNIKGALPVDDSEVFIGICPHDQIQHFENLFPPIHFIDARRNIKLYATQLIQAQQRLNLKFSVV